MASSGLFEGKSDNSNYMIKISILNGCGEPGVAKQFAEYFQNNNFEIVFVGNADSYDYNETTLINHEKVPKKRISKLQKEIGIKENRLIDLPGADSVGDVKLIIGKDYKNLKLFKTFQS